MSFPDYIAGGSVDYKFATLAIAGTVAALTGGSVVVYKNNGTVESSTGVTLTADFDNRTGLNHLGIDLAADGSFYAANSNFQVVLATGTANSVSLNNYPLFHFTVEKQNHKPTGGTVAAVSGSVALTTAEHTLIADNTWDEAYIGHQTAGSFGKFFLDMSTYITDNVDVTVSSRLAPSGTVAAVTTIGNTGLIAIGTAIYDLAAGVETGLTFRQWARLVRAVMFGVSDASDSSAGTIVFYRKDGTTPAGTAVYNSQGDRTSTSEGSL